MVELGISDKKMRISRIGYISNILSIFSKPIRLNAYAAKNHAGVYNQLLFPKQNTLNNIPDFSLLGRHYFTWKQYQNQEEIKSI